MHGSIREQCGNQNLKDEILGGRELHDVKTYIDRPFPDCGTCQFMEQGMEAR